MCKTPDEFSAGSYTFAAVLSTSRTLQQRVTAAAADVSGTERGMNENQIMSNTSSSLTGAAVTEDIDSDVDEAGGSWLIMIIILAAGVAAVLCIVLCTYSSFIDSHNKVCCCCCPRAVTVSSLEELDQGTVAKEAGLFGLTLSERIQILEFYLPKKQIIFHAKSIHTTMAISRRERGDVDEEAAGENEDIGTNNGMLASVGRGSRNESPERTLALVAKEIELEEQEGVARNTTCDITSTCAVKEEQEDEPFFSTLDIEQDVFAATTNRRKKKNGAEYVDEDTLTTNAPTTTTQHLADHEITCCICLAEYEDGCTILTGDNCIHKLHYDCSLPWALRHDHCPHCRQVLVSPTNFRNAAVHVLGEARVKILATSPR